MDLGSPEEHNISNSNVWLISLLLQFPFVNNRLNYPSSYPIHQKRKNRLICLQLGFQTDARRPYWSKLSVFLGAWWRDIYRQLLYTDTHTSLQRSITQAPVVQSLSLRISLSLTVTVYGLNKRRSEQRTDNIEPQWRMCSCTQATSGPPLPLSHTLLIWCEVWATLSASISVPWLHVWEEVKEIVGNSFSFGLSLNIIIRSQSQFIIYGSPGVSLFFLCLFASRRQGCPPVAINCCFHGDWWCTSSKQEELREEDGRGDVGH